MPSSRVAGDTALSNQAKIHRTDTNGHQFYYGLVSKETYEFMRDYKGLFSLGVALDRLVVEVMYLREKLEARDKP